MAEKSRDYRDALTPAALKGARIGVARKQYFGYSDAADAIVNAAIADMKAQGAVIVDPANIPTAAQMDGCENEVLLYEFKADVNKYLASRGASSPVHTLADLIAFNERERTREMPYFGQEQFVSAQKKGPLTSPAYTAARVKCRALAREQGIDRVLRQYRLDAIVAPTGSPAWMSDLVNGDHFTGASSTPAAVAGYPSITVPAGEAFGLPVGMSFIGAANSEAKLIGLAYAYEQATHHRHPPRLEPHARNQSD
jgi:amidase